MCPSMAAIFPALADRLPAVLLILALTAVAAFELQRAAGTTSLWDSLRAGARWRPAKGQETGGVPSANGSEGLGSCSLSRRSAGAEGEEFKALGEKPERLWQAWAAMYGLKDVRNVPRSVAPPPNGSVPGWGGGIPRAPHLEECAALTAERAALDQWDASGRPPAWTLDGNGTGPQPPWVAGADDDNLARTRVVQRDIWRRQFPPDCADPSLRFLLYDFLGARGHGLGSQLHYVTVALSYSLRHNRTLVYNPGTFDRANHRGCQGAMRKSHDCYWAPVSPPACQLAALAALAAQPPPAYNRSTIEEALASDLRVVHFNQSIQRMKGLDARAASLWGTPWRERNMTFELMGRIPTRAVRTYRWTGMRELVLQTHWWRAQAVRFMFRWPSAYLCHTINRIRHAAYGCAVATRVAAALRARDAGAAAARLWEGELEELEDIDPLRLPFVEENPGMRRPGPFIFRPIVSVHVRQGDKGREMKVYSLAAYMWLAERQRLLDPALQHVWLSTEMQSVIEESKNYTGWRFLYNDVPRQRGGASMERYEFGSGLERTIPSAFANLWIASECDYFVGVLASNWNRLINELRTTNGRLKAGYAALNYWQW